MHRRPALPLGLKFDPDDVELISGYLYPKFHGGRLPWNAIGSCDLVYEKPPWEFCTDLTAFPGDEKHYFFTERKRNGNRVVRAVGSYGTWHESSSKNISGIGFNKLLNFKVKGEGKMMNTTDWLMHEFSLPDKKINLVLCVIQKKKKKQKEEMGSAYDTNPEIDPNSFLDCEDTSPAALDTEEEETRPSKKMRSDREFDDDKFCGGDPCPAAAHGDQFKLQALASEEEETRPSKKMQSDPEIGDDPFCGGDPCPAPTHGDQDSEEEETRPSKKIRSDPKLDDQPVSVASSSVDLPMDYWDNFAADLLGDAPALPDDEFGLLDDVPGLPNAVFGLPDDDFFNFQL